jgi:predicted TIM-barrel fold metal-dependent hydrolase
MRIPIIDSDAHIGEPANLWVDRIEPKDDDQRRLIPQVRRNEEKDRLEWFVGDVVVSAAPSSTVLGWKGLAPSNPPTFEDAHPACFDPDERVKLMDQEGIWAEVLFPNVGGLGNEGFLKIEDAELRAACVRAYNDFLTDHCNTHPGRLIPVGATMFWDIDACIKELERTYEMGHRALLFSGKPDVFWGQPHLADPYWDPLWARAQEMNLPVAFHVGPPDPTTGPWWEKGYKGLPTRTRYTSLNIMQFTGLGQTIVDLIYGGVAQRFPELKFVVVETGLGWISFLLETIDYHFLEHRIRESSPNLTLMPSEYFRRQMYVSYWYEVQGPQHDIDFVGRDNVMFETDFPHPTGLWPPESIATRVKTSLANCPVELVEKVLFKNAASLYNIAPPPDTWEHCLDLPVEEKAGHLHAAPTP